MKITKVIKLKLLKIKIWISHLKIMNFKIRQCLY